MSARFSISVRDHPVFGRDRVHIPHVPGGNECQVILLQRIDNGLRHIGVLGAGEQKYPSCCQGRRRIDLASPSGGLRLGDAGRDIGWPKKRQTIARGVGAHLTRRNDRQPSGLCVGAIPRPGRHDADAHDLPRMRHMVLLRHIAAGRHAGDRYGGRIDRMALEFVGSEDRRILCSCQDRGGQEKPQDRVQQPCPLSDGWPNSAKQAARAADNPPGFPGRLL